ncbi:MAG: hypothetical protein M3R38_23680 [Actinomycetota bacterium]|nr:hypothetical protein [Actinomycetota bacterium]
MVGLWFRFLAALAWSAVMLGAVLAISLPGTVLIVVIFLALVGVGGTGAELREEVRRRRYLRDPRNWD